MKAALVRKGMVQEKKKDHVMFSKTVDGVTRAVTRISHSAHEIADHHGRLMSKQCGVSIQQFWDLIDCPLSEEEWDTILRDAGSGRSAHGHTR